MKRLQVHVSVDDLAHSIRFYTTQECHHSGEFDLGILCGRSARRTKSTNSSAPNGFSRNATALNWLALSRALAVARSVSTIAGVNTP